MTNTPPNEPSWDDIFRSQPGRADGPTTPDAATPAEPEPGSRRARRLAERPPVEPGAPPPAPTSGVAAAAAEASALPSRRDAREHAPLPPRRRRRRWGWIVALVLVLGALGGGAYAAWTLFEPQIREVLGISEPNDFEGSGNGTEIDITIVSGDIGADIARTLQEQGVTMTFDAFYDLLLEREAAGEAASFEPGTYRLQGEMSAASALDALLDPANRMTSVVQIPEGVVMARELELISAGAGVPLEELQAAVADPQAYGVPAEAPSLEGYLFPATWQFDPGTPATEIVQRLVNRTFEELDAAGVAPEDRHRVLTIASLVQREARLGDDFYRVSRVIQNRLDEGMMLQFDSTSHYGVDSTSGSVFTTDAERADDNPYNTYVIEGLPVGPISAPGAQAIDAAINPVDGPWLFFVTVDLESGETVFTTTADEHAAAVQQLQSWCRDNPDYCG
jgi:UPF0755 protein